ncbi:MAG: acyl-CoA dehydrogenase family protein, partial [Elusimicrobiota bacterium]
MTEEEKFDVAGGGYFVLPGGLGFPVNEKIFVPEKFSDEQKIVSETTRKFMEEKVLQKIKEIDSQKGDYGLTVQLLREAAELGFLGTDVPEKYGGAGFDFITTTLVSEIIGIGGSWAISWADQCGISSHPLLFFGTEEQKKKYLSKLATGELIGAFATTEPSGGTDLRGIKTKASVSPDG